MPIEPAEFHGSMSTAPSPFDLVHIFAHSVFDQVLQRSIRLPEEALFHAPDQADFWNIVLEVIRDPVQLTVNLSPDANTVEAIRQITTLIEQSGCSRVVDLQFSQ